MLDVEAAVWELSLALVDRTSYHLDLGLAWKKDHQLEVVSSGVCGVGLPMQEVLGAKYSGLAWVAMTLEFARPARVRRYLRGIRCLIDETCDSRCMAESLTAGGHHIALKAR